MIFVGETVIAWQISLAVHVQVSSGNDFNVTSLDQLNGDNSVLQQVGNPWIRRTFFNSVLRQAIFRWRALKSECLRPMCGFWRTCRYWLISFRVWLVYPPLGNPVMEFTHYLPETAVRTTVLGWQLSATGERSNRSDSSLSTFLSEHKCRILVFNLIKRLPFSFYLRLRHQTPWGNCGRVSPSLSVSTRRRRWSSTQTTSKWTLDNVFWFHRTFALEDKLAGLEKRTHNSFLSGVFCESESRDTKISTAKCFVWYVFYSRYHMTCSHLQRNQIRYNKIIGSTILLFCVVHLHATEEKISSFVWKRNVRFLTTAFSAPKTTTVPNKTESLIKIHPSFDWRSKFCI